MRFEAKCLGVAFKLGKKLLSTAIGCRVATGLFACPKLALMNVANANNRKKQKHVLFLMGAFLCGDDEMA